MTHDVATLFASLADPTRRRIVGELARGDRTVNELVGIVALRQPTISKHLKVLEHAGLLLKQADRNRRICRLNPDALRLIEDWAASHRRDWEARLDNLDRYLGSRKERP